MKRGCIVEDFYVKFIIMRLAACERKKTLLESLMLKYQKEKYYKKLLSKLPYVEKGVLVVGRYGLEIELPFTENDIVDMELSYIELYIRTILDKYDIPECYLQRELNCMQGKFGKSKKWIFSYLMFQKGIDLFMKEQGISKKDTRFVLIDSGDQKIEVILQAILEYANYLTIMTDREQYFENAVDIIYEETGLMVDVISKRNKKQIHGDFIINLDHEEYRLYSGIEEHSCIMDMAFTNTKLEYLTNRKRNVHILYDYEMSVDGEEIEPELLAEVMVRDNWKLSRFVKRSESVLSQDEIAFILKDYGLELEKLKVIHL